MKIRIGGPILAALVTSVSAMAQSPVRTFVSVNGVDNAQCLRAAPCRTFNAAVAVVADDGEVVALDTGGYGPMTITRSVTVHVASGVIAAIAPTTGNAIEIDAPGETVVVRNLYLNSQGGGIGIMVSDALTLHVEGVVVSGFLNGGLFTTVASDSEIFVLDTILRENGDGAFLQADSPSLVLVSMDRVRAENNARYGIFAGLGSTVVVSNSVASGQGSTLDSSGFRSGGGNGNLSIHNSTASFNTTGVYCNGTSVRVSGSMVTGNNQGVFTVGSCTLSTYSNNSARGNFVNGSFNHVAGMQ